jgi:hypothetical protein
LQLVYPFSPCTSSGGTKGKNIFFIFINNLFLDVSVLTNYITFFIYYGLPFLAMYVIWRYKRQNLLEDHYTHLQIGTLYDGYRVEDRWYWEGVFALRKLAMVSVSFFLSLFLFLYS